MPALTATSALVGAMVLLGLWSGRRWGRRRKRALDAELHSFHANRDGWFPDHGPAALCSQSRGVPLCGVSSGGG